MRTLPAQGYDVVGIDVRASPFTHHVGSITDRAFVAEHMHGADVVLHTATLHKPHVATHSRHDFVATNIEGTLNLLEEAVAADVAAFVLTSTTSAFGRALTPPPGAPAAWVTEDLLAVPRNIYGVTKIAAENLGELFHHLYGLPCVVLRTSRFFPEDDDQLSVRQGFSGPNAKVNELLNRRVDIEDVVSAHVVAAERAAAIGFGRYIISATTPFTSDDRQQLRDDAPAVVARVVPAYVDVFARHGWTMTASLDRVYVNGLARTELGWQPQWDFARAVARLAETDDVRSPLAIEIGSRGYHPETFAEGPYPV